MIDVKGDLLGIFTAGFLLDERFAPYVESPACGAFFVANDGGGAFGCDNGAERTVPRRGRDG